MTSSSFDINECCFYPQRQIQKSSQSALISILDAGNTPVFQIASSSDGVLVSGTTLSFNLPHDVPLQRGDVYKIRVDEGAVRSAGDCEAAPSAAEWDFIFESFCDGDYRPLAVVLEDSVPAIGAEMKGNVVSVTYNKKVRSFENCSRNRLDTVSNTIRNQFGTRA